MYEKSDDIRCPKCNSFAVIWNDSDRGECEFCGHSSQIEDFIEAYKEGLKDE